MPDDTRCRYSASGILAGPAGSTIDWVEFELYNIDSDWYPSHTITGGETDFYISYMQIVIPEPSSVTLAMLGAGGALFGAVRRSRRSR